MVFFFSTSLTTPLPLTVTAPQGWQLCHPYVLRSVYMRGQVPMTFPCNNSFELFTQKCKLNVQLSGSANFIMV